MALNVPFGIRQNLVEGNYGKLIPAAGLWARRVILQPSHIGPRITPTMNLRVAIGKGKPTRQVMVDAWAAARLY